MKERNDIMTKKSQSIAPSGFRCKRQQWFRIRGVDCDEPSSIDTTLVFTAELGTECHKIIQSNLKEILLDDWIPVDIYIDSVQKELPYEITSVETYGYESRVTINDPPIRFACDGIVRINNQIYLLEIKTSEHVPFSELEEPKPVHVDQVKFYSAILHLPKALVLYQDRLYGSLKCYEVEYTKTDWKSVYDDISNIIECVNHSIAPDKLPANDYTCKHCSYQSKCKLW